MRTAIITGVTGQDGSYLTEFLLNKNYKVYGIARRTSTDNSERISHIIDENFEIVQGDITDAHSINAIIQRVQPDEVYNLAAQSHVRTSFDQPVLTWNVTAGGCLNLLEALRQFCPRAKFYQAGSSEMFGSSVRNGFKVKEQYEGLKPEQLQHVQGDGLIATERRYQDEDTPFHPRSPYAVAKLAAHHMTKIYRDGYKLFACNGILFNHESERRCPEFVSRKISLYVAKLYANAKKNNIPLGMLQHMDFFQKLKLGNLEAYRDWGYAPDFVKAMWLMLQEGKSDDYVIATGETHSVREFLVTAFQTGLGYYSDSFVETDPSLYRATEVNYLCGDYSKAKRILNWEPETKFNDLVVKMVISDIRTECMKHGLPYAEGDSLI